MKSVVVESFNDKAAIRKAQQLNMLPCVAIYQSPLDFPDKFVARIFYSGKAVVSSKEVIVADNYAELIIKLNPFIDALGMARIKPSKADDIHLVETWL